MRDRLEYRLVGPAKSREGLIEIAAPKDIVDGATSLSLDSPLLRELRAAPSLKVMTRSFDSQGRVIISFDLEKLPNGYFSGPVAERSARTLDLITYLDMYANRRGAPDPRISIRSSRASRALGLPEEEGAHLMDMFRVSFERPKVDDDSLVERIRFGMVWAAKNLHLHQPIGVNDQMISVSLSEQTGLVLGTHGADQFPVLEADLEAETKEGRIELSGDSLGARRGNDSHSRLVALVGVMRALDPLPERPDLRVV